MSQRYFLNPGADRVLQRVQHKIQSQTKLGSFVKLAGSASSSEHMQTRSPALQTASGSAHLRSTSVRRVRPFVGPDEQTASADHGNSLQLVKLLPGARASDKQARTLSDVFQVRGLSKRLLPTKLPEHLSSCHVSVGTAAPVTPCSFKLSNKPPPRLYEKLLASRTCSSSLTTRANY